MNLPAFVVTCKQAPVMEPSQSSNSEEKYECEDGKDFPKQGDDESKKDIKLTEEKPAPKYFKCDNCILHEKYEYFGKEPSFLKKYVLCEEAYVIEDPFLPKKQGEIVILGAHCIKCNKSVCKDSNCSFYYAGTYCIQCAKINMKQFPQTVQDKLNKIVVTYFYA